MCPSPSWLSRPDNVVWCFSSSTQPRGVFSTNPPHDGFPPPREVGGSFSDTREISLRTVTEVPSSPPCSRSLLLTFSPSLPRGFEVFSLLLSLQVFGTRHFRLRGGPTFHDGLPLPIHPFVAGYVLSPPNERLLLAPCLGASGHFFPKRQSLLRS